ncbi:MAG: MalY/PatB family protein [Chitinophagales bacterium]
MKYNFDKIIDRQHTNAMSVEGYREYLFNEGDELNIPCEEKDLIRMWVADMAFPTAPEIIDCIKERVEHGIFGYSKVFNPKYLEAFSNWTESRYGWKFNKEHLVHSQGIVPALYKLIEFLCKPKGKVLIMTPSYAFFKHAVDHNEVELITSDLIYKEGHYVMDFKDLQQKTADTDIVLSILCNPHNPTGRVWTAKELKQFGEICLANEVSIISDEIHCDLLRAEQQFTPLAKLFPDSDQIITCMSPSKTFNMAGFMFSNLIIPNDKLREKWQEDYFGVENPLSITAAQAAYTYGMEWLKEVSIYIDNNFDFLQQYLSKHLPKVQFTISEATYLAWINLDAYFSKEENLTLFFANHAGVLLEGGNMFVSNSDGFIRLNLACPKSILEEGLKRITQAIITRNRI